MLKRLLNRSRDLLFLPGVERFWRPRLLGRVTVLVYHRVGEAPDHDFLDEGEVPRITTTELRNELRFLADLGARFMTFRDLREEVFPAADEIGVIVSFDDGFRDSYEQGLPVVESLDGRAVIFQCSAMLDAEFTLPEHRLFRLLFVGTPGAREQNFEQLVSRLELAPAAVASNSALINMALMTEPFSKLQRALEGLDQASGGNLASRYPDGELLRSAHAAGHEIGSHGDRHLHRATLCDEEFEDELRTSKRKLTDVLGEPPRAFSYPFGAVEQGDARCCSRYFSQAATCERVPVLSDSSPLEMGRFSWPGSAPNALRHRRWLLTGSI